MQKLSLPPQSRPSKKRPHVTGVAPMSLGASGTPRRRFPEFSQRPLLAKIVLISAALDDDLMSTRGGPCPPFRQRFAQRRGRACGIDERHLIRERLEEIDGLQASDSI